MPQDIPGLPPFSRRRPFPCLPGIQAPRDTAFIRVLPSHARSPEEAGSPSRRTPAGSRFPSPGPQGSRRLSRAASSPLARRGPCLFLPWRSPPCPLVPLVPTPALLGPGYPAGKDRSCLSLPAGMGSSGRPTGRAGRPWHAEHRSRETITDGGTTHCRTGGLHGNTVSNRLPPVRVHPGRPGGSIVRAWGAACGQRSSCHLKFSIRAFRISD